MRCARSLGHRRSRYAADLGPAFASLLAAVAVSQACGGSGNSISVCPPGPDLCASYCANVLGAPCDWPAGAALSCLNECRSAASSLPADCMAAWEAALTCGSCATVTCPQQTCIDQGQGRICIDQPEVINGCDQESIAFRSCGGSCLQSPASWNEGGASAAGSFSRAVVTSRCACPAALEAGGAPGAACTSEMDCAEICCACATGHGRYRVRTCQNGRCLGEPEICADADGTGSSLASFCQG
jgi:hypothetical protein